MVVLLWGVHKVQSLSIWELSLPGSDRSTLVQPGVAEECTDLAELHPAGGKQSSTQMQAAQRLYDLITVQTRRCTRG